MSKKVIVTDISEKASEKTVKDFFLFCGKIKDFELIKEESSDKQIAYVTFEKETAAKTALMLTNAVICDSQITVKSADDADCDSGCGGDTSDDFGQEKKPKAIIFAEILAAGYTLQDTIIEKGIEFDAKFGISSILKQYLGQIQDNLKNLDQKFQVCQTVTTRATDINNKFSVMDHAKYVIEQAQDKANNFLATPTGKRICEYLFCTKQQVVDVQSLARRIADDKKHERSFNPTPSHSHEGEVEEVQDSNQPIPAQ